MAAILKFAFFNFVIRYLLENTLSILIPFVIEAGLNEERNDFSIIVTFFVLIVILLIFVYLFIQLLMNFAKISKGSKMYTLVDSMNTKSSFFLIYHIDFILIRVIIASMIFI